MTEGLMVVGVGRSGTSVATQMVAGLGLRLPSDLLPGNYANTQGYFESATLVHLCDRALDDLSSSWWKPPAEVNLSALTVSDEEARSAFVSVFGAGGGWAWKDPRLTVLLPWWDRVLGRQPVLVPFRNPLEVAASICARDNLSPDQALAVWERHTRLMLRAIAGRHVMLTDYAELLGDPVEWQRSVLEFCASAGLPVGDADPEVASLVIDSRSYATGELTPTQQVVADAVRGVRGQHDSFASLVLPPEDEATQLLIDAIKPPEWA